MYINVYLHVPSVSIVASKNYIYIVASALVDSRSRFQETDV